MTSRAVLPRHPDELCEAGVLTAALMTYAHLAALAIATRLNRRPAKGQAQKPALLKSSPM